MLPFSSLDFFIVSFFLVAYIYIAKAFLRNYVSYENNIFFVSLTYLILFYPSPIQVVLFVLYSYLAYVIFCVRLQGRFRGLGIFAILLPLLVIKVKLMLHLHRPELHDMIAFAGLSYMSFRCLSVYIDSEPDEERIAFIDYASYLIFFPSILIGPIDRLPRFKADLSGGYSRLNSVRFIDGWQLMIVGILFKFVCAKTVDVYWLSAVTPAKTLSYIVPDMYAYYLYLFFDFAGYSAMAIGVAKMIGIDLPINFNRPFLAINPPDLWKRWQKSLGDWLKDYFFTPIYLSSSRVAKLKPYPLLRQNFALFMTFLLMGCWNGLEWDYVTSGALFGVYSVVYNSYAHYCKKRNRDIIFGNLNPVVVRWISIFIMFNLVAIALYIFSGRLHPAH